MKVSVTRTVQSRRPTVRARVLPSSSQLCLGTMMFGDTIDRREAKEQLDLALELGVRSFDTAEMYPVPQKPETQGASEACIGDWMTGKDRSGLMISTKVAGPGSMTWIRGGPLRLDGRNIIAGVEGSLRRLGTDYIDLLLLHWPDRYVPMFGESEYDVSNVYEFCPFEEQIEALNSLHAQGKIIHFGLSNETAYGVAKFSSLCDSIPGGVRPSVIQNAYSLLCRTFTSGGLAEVCAMEGVGLMAYSPLAMGLLSGKYDDHGNSADPEARLMKFKGRYAEAESRYGPKPNVYKAVAAYVALAQQCGMHPVSLALRFVMSHPQVTSTVIGASSTNQLRLLADSWDDGPLDKDILAEIDAIHATYPNPTP
mmetsp:Transcript_10896/g.21693  ORF Transcript_10896/g.21693 Transcript_10896/m.21693 type:complete len:367 (-) Transcript_10896:1321-2421(-)